MSEYLSGGQGTLEEFVRAGEAGELFVKSPDVKIRSKGYMSGSPGYHLPGLWAGNRFFPGPYISGTPGYYYNEILTKEISDSEEAVLHIETAEKSRFALRMRLRIREGEEGYITALATSYDEEVKRLFYCNPDGEEIDEEEYLEKSEYNDEYYEDEEKLGTKSHFHLHFAPIVPTSEGGFEAVFNIPEEDMKDTLTLFLPTGPVPLGAMRGTEVLQALKKSLGNNDPEQDGISLRAWFDMAKSPSVPPQTRLVVAMAIDEYKAKHPESEKVFI